MAPAVRLAAASFTSSWRTWVLASAAGSVPASALSNSASSSALRCSADGFSVADIFNLPRGPRLLVADAAHAHHEVLGRVGYGSQEAWHAVEVAGEVAAVDL